ncbi:hypothetical protein Lal_00000882, partial [Lupinus albus]
MGIEVPKGITIFSFSSNLRQHQLNPAKPRFQRRGDNKRDDGKSLVIRRLHLFSSISFLLSDGGALSGDGFSSDDNARLWKEATPIELTRQEPPIVMVVRKGALVVKGWSWDYVDVLEDKNIWSACTALICFSNVEWHQTDRVRLQFKLLQDLPQPPQNLDALHKVDKRGNLDTNWATRHAEWNDYWSHRRDQVQQGPQIQYPIHTQQYIMWYRRNSRLFLSSEAQLRDPRQINYQQNQPPIYQQPTYQQPTYQPPTYQQNQPPIYNRNQQQPYYTNLPPIPQTS